MVKDSGSRFRLVSPGFFACIIFIQSFARSEFSGKALGSNLIGALVGGLLESLSLWSGIKALILVAALLYLMSLRSLHHEYGTSGLKKLTSYNLLI